MNLPLISQAFSGCQAPDVHTCSGRILWCGAGRCQCYGSATVESNCERSATCRMMCPLKGSVN